MNFKNKQITIFDYNSKSNKLNIRNAKNIIVSEDKMKKIISNIFHDGSSIFYNNNIIQKTEVIVAIEIAMFSNEFDLYCQNNNIEAEYYLNDVYVNSNQESFLCKYLTQEIIDNFELHLPKLKEKYKCIATYESLKGEEK